MSLKGKLRQFVKKFLQNLMSLEYFINKWGNFINKRMVLYNFCFSNIIFESVCKGY